MGILADQHKAVNAVRSVASNLTDAFKPELSTDLTDGLGGSLNGSVDAHMTKDVRHSMQENNRPIVNITVRNEGDVEYIKSYIEEQNGKTVVWACKGVLLLIAHDIEIIKDNKSIKSVITLLLAQF